MSGRKMNSPSGNRIRRKGREELKTGKGLAGRVTLFGLLISVAGFAAQAPNRSEIQRHYQRAKEALQSRQQDVAENEFKEILRLDPQNASAHANLGVIAFARQDYAQAAQEFRAALKLQPSLWNAEAYLGMSEYRLGNGKAAKPLLESAFQHVQDAPLRTQAGMDLIAIYHASKELARAVDVLRALRQSAPDDPAVLYLAYRTYSDLAAQQLTRLSQVAPESAQMHQILAQALASQDDYPGAIAQYRKALAANPQLPGLHFELGEMILMNSTGEPARQQAEQEFKLALAADPHNAHGEYMLGEIEWLRSKPEEALRHYQRALALQPGFVDAQIAAGKALTSLGQPSEALQHLQAAIALDPQNEVAHYRLAQAYKRLGRAHDADRELATFRQLRDSHAAARALYQQTKERPVGQQTVDPNEPQ